MKPSTYHHDRGKVLDHPLSWRSISLLCWFSVYRGVHRQPRSNLRNRTPALSKICVRLVIIYYKILAIFCCSGSVTVCKGTVLNFALRVCVLSVAFGLLLILKALQILVINEDLQIFLVFTHKFTVFL